MPLSSRPLPLYPEPMSVFERAYPGSLTTRLCLLDGTARICSVSELCSIFFFFFGTCHILRPGEGWRLIVTYVSSLRCWQPVRVVQCRSFDRVCTRCSPRSWRCLTRSCRRRTYRFATARSSSASSRTPSTRTKNFSPCRYDIVSFVKAPFPFIANTVYHQP